MLHKIKERVTARKVKRQMRLTRSDAANFYYEDNDLVINFFRKDRADIRLKGMAAHKAMEWQDDEGVKNVDISKKTR